MASFPELINSTSSLGPQNCIDRLIPNTPGSGIMEITIKGYSFSDTWPVTRRIKAIPRLEAIARMLVATKHENLNPALYTVLTQQCRDILDSFDNINYPKPKDKP